MYNKFMKKIQKAIIIVIVFLFSSTADSDLKEEYLVRRLCCNKHTVLKFVFLQDGGPGTQQQSCESQ